MFLRIVNLAGLGLDDHIRLVSGACEKSKTNDPGSDDEEHEHDLPDLRKTCLIEVARWDFCAP